MGHRPRSKSELPEQLRIKTKVDGSAILAGGLPAAASPKVSSKVRRMQLDWATLLPNAGIPKWLLACLSSHSREELGNEERILAYLAEMGVSDQLQRRHMLQELQCFLATIPAPKKPVPPPGCRRAKSGARPPRRCQNRSPKASGEESSTASFRWPFSPTSDGSDTSPCSPLDTTSWSTTRGQMASPVALRLPAMGSPSDAPPVRTPMGGLRASTVFGVPLPKSQSPPVDGEEPFEPLSVLTPRARARPPALDKDAVEYSRADSRWLENRLSPGGPLGIVEVLKKAGEQGDVDGLRAAMEKAREHGPTFVKSLDTIPMDSRPTFHASRSVVFTESLLSKAEVSPQSPGAVSSGVWSWAEEHLQDLMRAEQEFRVVINEARSAGLAAQVFSPKVSAVRNAMKTYTAYPPRPSSSDQTPRQMPISDGKITRSITDPVFGLQGIGGSPNQGEGLSDVSEDEEDQPRVARTVSENAPRRLSSERWQRCQRMSMGLGRTKSKGSTTLRVQELVGVSSFVHAQERLQEAEVTLRRRLVLADALRGVSRNRSALHAEAQKAIEALGEAQMQLFERFLQWLTPIQDELKLHTRGSCTSALEKSMIMVRHLVGSKTLLGETCMAAAETLGLTSEEEDEDPNGLQDPWGCLDLRTPPWEAVFTAACRRLTQLRGWDRDRARRAAFQSVPASPQP